MRACVHENRAPRSQKRGTTFAPRIDQRGELKDIAILDTVEGEHAPQSCYHRKQLMLVNDDSVRVWHQLAPSILFTFAEMNPTNGQPVERLVCPGSRSKSFHIDQIGWYHANAEDGLPGPCLSVPHEELSKVGVPHSLRTAVWM